jgi:hypothetical protein
MKKLLVLLIAFVATTVFAADPPPREKYAVDWFAEGCLRNLTGPGAIEAWAQSRQLPALPQEYTAGFLAGATGKAWSATNLSGEYVVVSRADGICTLFARVANVETAKPYFLEIVEHMLPSSRFAKESSTHTTTSSKGILETTHILVTNKKSSNLLHVVFSGTSSTSGNYQIAMSTRLCGGSKSEKATVPPDLGCGGAK